MKLFKIGAHIRLSVRRVWIAFSESYPYGELFAHNLSHLQRIPLRCEPSTVSHADECACPSRAGIFFA